MVAEKDWVREGCIVELTESARRLLMTRLGDIGPQPKPRRIGVVLRMRRQMATVKWLGEDAPRTPERLHVSLLRVIGHAGPFCELYETSEPEKGKPRPSITLDDLVF